MYHLQNQKEHSKGALDRSLKQAPKNPRALLAGLVFTGSDYVDSGGANLEELSRLVITADLFPANTSIQKRPSPRRGTWIGKGKINEMKELCVAEDIDIVVFACDLPYSVIHRLSEGIGVPVIDRSELILKIFARHAVTNEGRLQVKVATLDHSLLRLLKEEKDLDRQGGGIAVRGGPGETSATLIKRRIHLKRNKLLKRLSTVQEQRAEKRQRRRNSSIGQMALAGYTNAGKSTLLNYLCKRKVVEAADRLFTTLSTTTKNIVLPSGRPVLISDTVGFIEKLPHHLVSAFESTLVEAAQADLTLVLMESNVLTIESHRRITFEILEKLGLAPENRLPVFTKVDLLTDVERTRLRTLFPGAIEISARTGEGIDELLLVVEALLSRNERELELLIPFDKLELVDQLYSMGQVMRHEWTEKGFRLRARVPHKDLAQVIDMKV